jgi:hypothetical protein
MTNPVADFFVRLHGEIGDLQQKMSGAVGILKNTEENINKSTKSIASVIHAALAVAGVEALKKLTEGITELAAEGEKAENLKNAFISLGGSTVSLKKAEDAVKGVVDATDLMAAANKGLIAGIPQFAENFDKVADLGNKVANALGIDVKEGIDKVTEAIIRGKPIALQQVHIFVDTEAAAKKYAIAHGIAAAASGSFEKALNRQQKALANSQYAMEHLDQAIAGFPPVLDTVTKAHEAATASMKNLNDEIGIQLNHSPELIEAYRNQAEALKKIDADGAGQSIARLSALFVELKTFGIEATDKVLEQFSNDLIRAGLIINDLKRGDFLKIFDDDEFRNFVEGKNIEQGEVAFQHLANTVNNAFQSVKAGGQITTKEFNGIKAQAEEALSAIDKAGQRDSISKTYSGGIATIVTEINYLKEHAKDAVKPFGDGLDVAREKARQLGVELDKAISQKSTEGLKQNLEAAIKDGNSAGFQDYLEKYKASLSEQVDLELQKYKGLDTEKVNDLKTKMIADGVNPIMEQWSQKQKEMFQESVSFFEDIFTQMIDGTGLDFKKMLKQVAIGFAANMAAALTGSLSVNIKNPMDIGGLLAKQFFGNKIGGSQGGGVGGLAQSAIGGSMGGALSYAGGYGEGIMGTIGPVASADEYAGMMAGGSSMLATIGPAVPYVAAAAGAYMLAKHFGLF